METTSMIRSRISCASCLSCWRSSLRMSIGELIWSSSGVISGAAVANVTRDRREIVHRTADHISVFHSFPKELVDTFSGRLRAEQRGIGPLPLRRIFPRRLAELLGCPLLIEKVVNNLKRQAGRLAIAAQGFELRVGRARQEPAQHRRGGDELRGLVAVDEFQFL